MALRSLPTVKLADPAMQQAYDAVREVVQTWQGQRGDQLDTVVTYRDILGGTVKLSSGTVTVGHTAPGLSNTTGLTPVAVPTGLTASGVFSGVILSWDVQNTAALHHYEVWRQSEPVPEDPPFTPPDANLALAVFVGTADYAAVYTDPTVSPNTFYYYWVRAIDLDGQGTAFSAPSEITTSALDIAPVLATGGALVTLDTPTVIDGITYPAGVYSPAAFLLDLQVTRAKIRDAAINSAKIDNLAVGTAHVQDGAITNLKIGNSIQSAGWTGAAGTPGWRIDKNGNITVSGGAFTIYNTAGQVILASNGGPGAGLSGVVSTLNPITAANVSSYMQSLAVDTLYIANDAVTVPQVAAAFDHLDITATFSIIHQITLYPPIPVARKVILHFNVGWVMKYLLNEPNAANSAFLQLKVTDASSTELTGTISVGAGSWNWRVVGTGSFALAVDVAAGTTPTYYLWAKTTLSDGSNATWVDRYVEYRTIVTYSAKK